MNPDDQPIPLEFETMTQASLVANQKAEPKRLEY
jgi:hypothetical protein